MTQAERDNAGHDGADAHRGVRPPARQRGQGRSRWRIVAVAVAAIVVALGAAAAVAWRMLPSIVVREAAARGVVLEPGQVDVELGRVRLRGARFRLVDVRGLSGTIESATVELDGLSPRAVSAEGLHVTLQGGEPLPDLVAWADRFSPEPGDTLPVSATHARIAWSERAEGNRADEAVVLEDGTLSARGGSGTLRNARVLAYGAEVAGEGAQRQDVGWRTAGGELGIGLGHASVDDAPVRIDLSRAGATGGPPASPDAGAPPRDPARPTLRVSFRPVRVDALVTTLAPVLEPPAARGGPARRPRAPDTARGVTVEGTVEMPLPRFDATESIGGTMRLSLRGWVPPHPKELDGILFGDRTEVAGVFVVPPDRSGVELSDMTAAAGALRLAGTGSLRRTTAPDGAVVRADLSGSVPCTALAASAASARLGKLLGDFAGNLARRTLTGSVLVRVALEADLSRLDAARIEPSAVVRCKVGLPLRP